MGMAVGTFGKTGGLEMEIFYRSMWTGKEYKMLKNDGKIAILESPDGSTQIVTMADSLDTNYRRLGGKELVKDN
jgi:hypothetical protein